MAIKKKVKRAPAGKSAAEIKAMVDADYMEAPQSDTEAGAEASTRAMNAVVPAINRMRKVSWKVKQKMAAEDADESLGVGALGEDDGLTSEQLVEKENAMTKKELLEYIKAKEEKKKRRKVNMQPVAPGL